MLRRLSSCLIRKSYLFFSLNDFNWNVTPSDESTREFGLLYEAIRASLALRARGPCGRQAGQGEDHTDAVPVVRTQRDASGAKGARSVRATSGQGEDHTGGTLCRVASDKTEIYLYRYDAHAEELRAFIKQHFSQGGSQIQVNKNNFVAVYQRWLATVQPSIAVDWALLKKQGIIDGDFFLADLLSEHNQTLKEALYVLLQDNRYVFDRRIDLSGFFVEKHVSFNDKQRAHAQFWSLYQRPPREEYWAYIIDRRDLLVPQDVRERKGSFFTPRQWVELSQQYIADVLGENWQEEYYVWDCAAGTGNLLNGLTNKYNIWASTLDPQDVQVMKDRIANGANLLESHVFQFDFLNDEFDKLPAGLQEIINDPQKRRKLVVYINPPYKEASKYGTKGQKGVEQSRTNKLYMDCLGQANSELFAQFYIRIYKELFNAIIAGFATLKILQGAHFTDFRNAFRAKLYKLFIVPAYTFDNVVGHFPIGFMIWKSDEKEIFEQAYADVYNQIKEPLGRKLFIASNIEDYINQWIKPIRAIKDSQEVIGKFPFKGNDFQNQQYIQIVHREHAYHVEAGQFLIDKNNLIVSCIYFAVRKSIPQNWLNNQDQFLRPRDGWQTDTEFQNNSLTFTLFSNNIQSQYGTNHWIPFTEAEVNARDRFESHFMTDFMAGKLVPQADTSTGSLFQSQSFVPTAPLVFSPEATAVFDAGRDLWRYYHAQPHANPNASYYDIRAHFQGRNDKGKMNAKSDDPEYMRLWGELKEAMEVLRQRIVPKVYEYGFLIA